VKPSLLAEKPKIEIVLEVEGKQEVRERKMSSLTIKEVFAFSDLIESVFTLGKEAAAEKLKNVDLEPAQIIGIVIALGIKYSRHHVMDFLAGLIGMDVQEFASQPLGVTGQVVAGLTVHPDLSSFFASLKEINTGKVTALLGNLSS
jgi:hypothetical protein